MKNKKFNKKFFEDEWLKLYQSGNGPLKNPEAYKIWDWIDYETGDKIFTEQKKGT